MEFFGALIASLIKMVIVGAFAFAGIQCGRRLRKRKDEKTYENSQN